MGVGCLCGGDRAEHSRGACRQGVGAAMISWDSRPIAVTEADGRVSTKKHANPCQCASTPHPAHPNTCDTTPQLASKSVAQRASICMYAYIAIYMRVRANSIGRQKLQGEPNLRFAGCDWRGIKAAELQQKRVCVNNVTCHLRLLLLLNPCSVRFFGASHCHRPPFKASSANMRHLPPRVLQKSVDAA